MLLGVDREESLEDRFRCQRPAAIVLGVVAPRRGPVPRRPHSGPPAASSHARRRSSAEGAAATSSASPAACSPTSSGRSRSPRCCSWSRWSAGWCSPAAAASRPSCSTSAGRREPTSRHERGPRRRTERCVIAALRSPATYYLDPRRDALHHRRRRPARAPQRPRDVHVRRAHAQRRQPHVRHVRPTRSTTSAARRSCSSRSWSRRPRSRSVSRSSWPSSGAAGDATADDIDLLKGARRNVRGDGDVCIDFVAPENIYLEAIFLWRFHLLISFFVQTISYQ